MEPAKIESFKVDHDLLDPGVYISRRDGNVVTYDLRTRKPNAGDYMDNLTMHSLEHMFATYVRSSAIGADVLYFGPMGCQTGFYLLVQDRDPYEVYDCILTVLRDVMAHTGPMFGGTRKECGNYRNLSVDAAKAEAERYYTVLTGKETINFAYRTV